jgi:hypothetical protein
MDGGGGVSLGLFCLILSGPHAVMWINPGKGWIMYSLFCIGKIQITTDIPIPHTVSMLAKTAPNFIIT